MASTSISENVNLEPKVGHQVVCKGQLEVRREMYISECHLYWIMTIYAQDFKTCQRIKFIQASIRQFNSVPHPQFPEWFPLQELGKTFVIRNCKYLNQLHLVQ